MSTSSQINYGELQFDFDRNLIRRNEIDIELEPKVMEVLALLYDRQGNVVSQEEIFKVVWSGRVFNRSLIQRAIALIRKAMGEEATTAKLLITYPKKGYCLTQLAPSDEPRKSVSSWSWVSTSCFTLLLVISVILIYLSTYDQRSDNYTSLSPLTNKPLNEYSVSPATDSKALLFIRNVNYQYELWKKLGVTEEKLLSTTTKLHNTFWFNGSPAYTQIESENKVQFYQIDDSSKKKLLLELSELPVTEPFEADNGLYIATKHQVYFFDRNANLVKKTLEFNDVNGVIDWSFSLKRNEISVLVDKGQMQFRVILVNLSTHSTTELDIGNGEFNSVDWHPFEPHLLLAKYNQLLKLHLTGEMEIIHFTTHQKINAAKFAFESDIILLEHEAFNIAFQTYNSRYNLTKAETIDFSGANLFPRTNPVDNQILFQSDYSGRQALYIKNINTLSQIASDNTGTHYNGFTWSPNGNMIAYSKNNIISIQKGENVIKEFSLNQSVYIRDWYKNKNALLVNQLIDGDPFPSFINLTNGDIEALTKETASCPILDDDDNLYFVLNDSQLIKQSPYGQTTVVQELNQKKFDDVFFLDGFLYTSIYDADGHYVQKINVNNFEIQQDKLPKGSTLAGIANGSEYWLYNDVRRSSQLYVLSKSYQ